MSETTGAQAVRTPRTISTDVLERFEVGDNADLEYSDPPLACTECGEVVCTVEPGDSLLSLASVAEAHAQECAELLTADEMAARHDAEMFGSDQEAEVTGTPEFEAALDLTCKCGPDHADCGTDCQCECHDLDGEPHPDAVYGACGTQGCLRCRPLYDAANNAIPGTE